MQDIKKLQTLFEPLTPQEQLNKARLNANTAPSAPDDCKKTRVDGDEAYVFEDDAFLSSGQTIGVVRQDRFAEIPLHVHNYIELVYVWSGCCRQTINGEEILCRSGDVVILDTNTAHSIRPAGIDDIIINVLMRREYFAAAFFRRLTRGSVLAQFLAQAAAGSRLERSYLLFRAQEAEDVSGTMLRLLYEYFFESIGCAEMVDSYVIILFTQLLRKYRSSEKSARPDSRSMRVLDILEYMDNSGEALSLTQTAARFGLHPSYLTSILKEETGKSYVEHQQLQKLSRARILLEDTDMPVSDIIQACGYQNASFFYRKFFKALSCTPAEYRKQFRHRP